MVSMGIWKPKELLLYPHFFCSPTFPLCLKSQVPQLLYEVLRADCAVRAREANGALGILLLRNFFSWSGWKNEDTLQHPWSKLWEAHSWGNFSLGEMTVACSASVQAHSSMLHWPCREVGWHPQQPESCHEILGSLQLPPDPWCCAVHIRVTCRYEGSQICREKHCFIPLWHHLFGLCCSI